jgi:threonine dehydrogenase-like Zn-dependent dehydrogenase
MKAIVYNGPRDVEVKEMPDPSIQHPSDVIVKVTTTNICGSDLHMYEGRTSLEPGKIIGHENLGEILECGPAVASLKRGDYVCIPCNAACGYCKNCERGQTAACLTLNPGNAGAGYGYAGMGELQGAGQTNVKSYNGQLCQMIESGKVRPSFIVAHRLSAPEAYQHFDARENGWTKVVLRPNEAKPAERGVPAARRTQSKGQHESHRQARH